MIFDIWRSFGALPIWVQIWSALILFPVNMGVLFFLHEPQGATIAGLALAGAAGTAASLVMDRGFSKRGAIPHVLFWTPLVFAIYQTLPTASGAYHSFLITLLVFDIVSLGFDYPDAIKWLRGDRAVAGA